MRGSRQLRSGSPPHSHPCRTPPVYLGRADACGPETNPIGHPRARVMAWPIRVTAVRGLCQAQGVHDGWRSLRRGVLEDVWSWTAIRGNAASCKTLLPLGRLKGSHLAGRRTGMAPRAGWVDRGASGGLRPMSPAGLSGAACGQPTPDVGDVTGLDGNV